MKAALLLVTCGLIAIVVADEIKRYDLTKLVSGVPKDRGVVEKFLKKIRPVRQAYIFCPDGSTCPYGNTCCAVTEGGYGCCNIDSALCCPGNTCCSAAGNECCPEGNCCPTGSTCCGDYCCGNNGVCCSGQGCCGAGSTCCLLSNGGIGCCPVSGATCCVNDSCCVGANCCATE
jgi:hypothetical protein